MSVRWMRALCAKLCVRHFVRTTIPISLILFLSRFSFQLQSCQRKLKKIPSFSLSSSLTKKPRSPCTAINQHEKWLYHLPEGGKLSESRQWLVPQYGCAACTQGCTYQWLNEVVHDVMCILGPLVDYSIHKEHRHLNTQCLLPSQIPTRFLIWFLTRHFITQLNFYST